MEHTFISVAHCPETSLVVFDEQVLLMCPHCKPKIIKSDGSIQVIDNGGIYHPNPIKDKESN